MKKILITITIILSFNSTILIAQTIHPDSILLIKQGLNKKKQELSLELSKKSGDPIALLERMLELGMWQEALQGINLLKKGNPAQELLLANYLILNNDFKTAEKHVNQVLVQYKQNEQAIYLKSILEMHAWRLSNASSLLENAIKNKSSEKLQLMLGRIRILEKKYPEALEIAKKTLKLNPNSAGAYLLEADAYFWDQQADLALAPLQKSLEIDPFNADARFYYGYAIWRKIDARLLNDMANQWDIALSINPLHYQTHWHWGNGHTNLTYADYAEKDDDQIRKELEKSDELVRDNKIAQSLAYTNSVKEKYPKSILPDLHKASIYYTAYDLDRKTRLDSAEHIFRNILEHKKHYGPAHNGLSAVIKSKRISFLSTYDSITNELNKTKISDLENFKKVFPDVDYFPGDAVKAMAWNQLYTSVVYFPFLSKQNNSFRIPPLHKDLAVTMNAPYFRFMTTFDNRQWMDIRGVGSGAAAIEYVERGAFMERNVILHEYVHLFHGRVLSDSENRAIRALYYQAMTEKRTLDYYSQNNESEYFAQTYPAYFEPIKVHPLDFKSMNTSSDLMKKDPKMYQFLDQLIKKERAYLAGNKQAMATNWAQVYINLSNASKQKNKELASAHLDTALNYDSKYLPAFLAKAFLSMENNDFGSAENWIQKAEQINPKYAPIYVTYAELRANQVLAKKIDQQKSQNDQIFYLNKAFGLEDDYQELADINRNLREVYKSYGMIPEAIQSADNYAKNASVISTYLRDQRNDALAFSAALRSELGDKMAKNMLKELVEQKPQNYEFRNLYADALFKNKDYERAILTIKEAQRILTASGNSRADFNLRIAEFYQEMGKMDSTESYLKSVKPKSLRDLDKLRLARLLISNQKITQADEVLTLTNKREEPYFMAEYFYTLAILDEAKSDKKGSIEQLEKVIAANPFHLKAIEKLVECYENEGLKIKAEDLKSRLNQIKNMKI
ncbi:tetratricopeptide repeat protein [Daejeonella sp.]|jgi:tetratricopeptide (TPR) repeat protein|uniref:tetratricopeptide repeat protein n=1 Tax=Daejeonella sp. TaxID=2805397 RepID=UPI0037BFBBC4